MIRRLVHLLGAGALALMISGCGDDSIAEAPGDDPAATTSSTALNGGDTTTTPAPETTTTTTTLPPADPLPTLDAADIPGLIEAWESGDGEPLELAEQLIGFPMPVATPVGTSAYSVALDMNAANPDELAYWEWSYEATTDGEIADIDISLDDNGPGSVELRETYDPILADLGWRYSNSTGSDPSSGAGGPQSINHVYVSNAETFPLGDTLATPGPLFVWADEELIFGEGVPGYRVDVDLEIEPGFVAAPLIATLIADVPVGDGDRLIGVDLLSWTRPADSFDAAEGLRYIDVTVDWLLADGTADDRRATLALEISGIYQAGEESFFDPGVIEATEPTSFNGDWQQPLVVLDRYEGSLEIVEDPDSGAATLTLEIRFEANREVLEPLPE